LDERGVEHVGIEYYFFSPPGRCCPSLLVFPNIQLLQGTSSPGSCDLEKLIEVFSNNGSFECLGTFKNKLGPDGLPS
jgi:hypothetical protein